MNTDFKPSTVKLFSLLGWNNRRYISEKDETYQVYSVTSALSSKAYNELGRDAYNNGSWSADKSLIEALRAALRDHQHDYAGKAIAHTLVRYGCRKPETMAGLDAWDALMFIWQKEKRTGESVAGLLQKAGIVKQVSVEAIEKLNAWIKNPLKELGNRYNVIFSLFEEQAIYSSLRDISFTPEHDKLFQRLAQSAIPPVEITEVSQRVDSEQRFVDVTEKTYLTAQAAKGMLTYRVDGNPQLVQEGVQVLSESGAQWVIQFTHAGKKHAFFAKCNGTWMDVASVIKNFNLFIASLGRSEQAFCFKLGISDDGEHGMFIVADSKAFPEVAKQLHIPLRDFALAANP